VAYNFDTRSDASFVRIKILIVKESHGFILDLLQDKVKKSYEMERISIPVIRKGFGK
jgi:hypothetical protein